MKNRIVALVCGLVLCGCLIAFAKPQAAAPSSPAPGAVNHLPVITIQEVETDSPETYAMVIAQNNTVRKEKFGVDRYITVAIGENAGPDTGKVFTIRTADSFAKLASLWEASEQEISLVRSRIELNQLRKAGPNVAYKAIRFDGRNETWFSYNTRVTLTDEAGYLSALDGLRALFDAHDFKDVKINCYRAVAGRTEFSHMVSLNCPSRERRAAMLDAINSEPWAQEWIAAAAKYRTVVSNGNYRVLGK